MKWSPCYLAEAIGTFCLVFAGTGAQVYRLIRKEDPSPSHR